MFDIIIIVLEEGTTTTKETTTRTETKANPRGSARRCYICWGEACRDPYTGNSDHEFDCWPEWDHCLKVTFFNGKWLHSRHLNIYKRQSHKISQNM
jgi:hypothetical protein